MVVSRIEDEKQFLLDNPKREMSKLEIYGAMYQLRLATDYEVDMETIDYNTFYLNKSLNIMGGLLIGDMVIDSVFVLGNNKEDLFGYAYYDDYEDEEEEELFLVRIS